jgi:histidyl-tRNA synthetase
MSFGLPRGMRDIEPDDYELLERVRVAFSETARTMGFRVMEPSPIEMLGTLEAKSGPGIREEIYHFVDKGSREVGLRFDLTVGLTRYVVPRRDLEIVGVTTNRSTGGTGGSTSGMPRSSAPRGWRRTRR